MFNSVFNILYSAIGLYSFSFEFLIHMIIRGSIIYGAGVIVARFNKKLIGIRTPFNFILFVMLGSISANAVLDEKIFLAVLGTTLFLITLNVFIAMLSFYFKRVEFFVKGDLPVLVKNGEIQWLVMRQHFITERELINELSAQLHTHDIKKVEQAYLIGDGSINFIKK